MSRTPSVKQIKPGTAFSRGIWELSENMTTSTGPDVQSGFRSDGASVPFILRFLVSPEGELFYPAIVHDDRLRRGFDWELAADHMRLEMEFRFVGKIKRTAVYHGILLWGKIRGYK